MCKPEKKQYFCAVFSDLILFFLNLTGVSFGMKNRQLFYLFKDVLSHFQLFLLKWILNKYKQ